jgi:hypothetical protein
MSIIPYKDPHFASIQNIKYINTDMLHIAANFVSSGKQEFVVQHGSSFYFHKTIADFRKEEITY